MFVTSMPFNGYLVTWSSKNVARAQSEDPDIGPVVDQLLQEWKKPTE